MKFLVAVDESEGSLNALTWTLCHLVGPAAGASDPTEQPGGPAGGASDPTEQPGGLILLHVQQPVSYLMQPVGPAAAVYPPILVMESVKKAQEENSRHLLGQAMEICLQRSCLLILGGYSHCSPRNTCFCLLILGGYSHCSPRKHYSFSEDTSNTCFVKAETMIMEGDVKEMICEAVDKLHPDMLIVGSRGLSKWKRTFLGSVSDYCAHHASCPVLIVKPIRASK